MRLPSEVKILHRSYSVRPMTVNELQDDDADGKCVPRWGVIKVSMQQDEVLIFETLLHEIAHAVNEAAGVDDHTSEEDAVTRTTPIWMQVWRDNPDLLVRLLLYAGE